MNKLNQNGAAHLLFLLASLGFILFLAISNTFDFRDRLFGNLFPKPKSEAVVNQLDLSASATTAGEINVFRKFIHTFQLPSQSSFAGLQGNVSLSTGSQHLAQALIQIFYSPSGNCPPHGSTFLTYEEIFNGRPDSRRLAAFILKSSSPGTVTIPTNFNFPTKVPIGGCLFLILDGGEPAFGESATMASNMQFLNDIGSSVDPAPYLIPIDDEFCYGQTWGCQLATTCTNETCAFAKTIPINSHESLWSLSGDVSAGAFTGSPYSDPPTGSWTAKFDYLIYKDCSSMQPGLSGPADFFNQIPPDAIHLLNITLQGNGKVAVQKEEFKTFLPTILEPGNCIVNLIRYSANGGATLESQIDALLQPRTPRGFFDSASCSTFDGWACDLDDFSKALDIHFYKDDPPGSGNLTFIGSTVADKQRELAVGNECGGNRNHGFSFVTPNSLKDDIQHSIFAFAINIPPGTNPQLNGSPKTILCSAPTPTPSPTPTPTTSPSPSPTPTPSPSPTPPPKVGDINGDGSVNVVDFSIMLSKWGTPDPGADLNGDGIVNVVDFSILLSNWGT